EVALEDGVDDMFTPHREALALAFLEVAAAHDSPPGIAREHPPAGLHLVIEVCESSQSCQRAKHLHDHLQLARIHILPVASDVPSAREDETGPWRRVVEHRLSGSRCVVVYATWRENHQHPVAPFDGALDDR